MEVVNESQCDGAQPSCKTCVSRDLQCLGYSTYFDRVHKDETDSTRRRVKKIKADVITLPSYQQSDQGYVVECMAASSVISSLNLVRYDKRISLVASTVPASLNRDFESAACDIFLAIYAEHHISIYANGGFMHHLFPMLRRTPVSSPLHKAVTTVAVSFAAYLSKDPSHTALPSKCYAEAAKSLRLAIKDNARNTDDDILMTTLMLDFCDATSLAFRTASYEHSRSHQLGALALARHRGPANFKNEASKAMIVSLQTAILHNALHARRTPPVGSEYWFNNPKMPTNIFTRLNDLTLDLTNILARRQSSGTTDIETWQDLLQLDAKYLDWYTTLPAACLPQMLRGKEIPPTVRVAGLYRDTCSVYQDLQVANILNVWRYRRIMLLHKLKNCSLLCTAGTDQPVFQSLLQTDATIQWLADGICESVPFFLGDYTDVLPPIYSSGLTFPTKITDHGTIPHDPLAHARHATGAGGWLVLTPLVNLCYYTRRSIESCPISLREGQLAWIQSQLRRLQYGMAAPFTAEQIAETSSQSESQYLFLSRAHRV